MKKSIYYIFSTMVFICCSFCYAACHSAKKTANEELSNTNINITSVTNSRWKLVEIYGKPVADKINDKEPILQFIAADGRYSVTGGCNNINGNYRISSDYRISFSKGLSTLMACEHMEVESELIQVLETADNFSLTENTFSLNKARMSPLAVFRRIP